MTAPAPGTWRIGPIVVAVLLGAIAATLCGGLGWWQWERAQAQGQLVVPGPAVPLADVARPGEATTGIGRKVTAEGEWADAPAAYVLDREVDGTAATLLVLPLRLDDAATGSGQAATLAVLAGWLPADEAPPAVNAQGPATVAGVLAGSEAAGAIDAPAVPGAPLRMTTLSTASLAQVWPGPVYSPTLTADTPAPGWNAFPAPEPQRALDIRSATYAAEWWLFGAFAVFLAARWIRDNGRMRPDAPPEGES